MASYGETALVRGLAFLAEKQAAIANNLANVDTASFKRRATVALPGETFQTMLDRELTTVGYSERSDMQRGVLRETSNRLDVAIDGAAWLCVQDQKGGRYYTRNGQLQVSSDGRLVTRDGLSVLDQNGQPIQVGTGEESPTDLSFSPNGTVGDPSTGRTWGPIAMALIPRQDALVPIGKSLFVDPEEQRTTQAGDGLQQGFLEGSNVDSLQELVQMITVERSFTATQKVLTGISRLQENLIANVLR